MDCCETDGFKPPIKIRERPTLSRTVKRRAVLTGMATAAGSAPFLASAAKASAATRGTIQLALCGQILCVPPYEISRDAGYFRDEGLDVQLVYMRGSTEATQALVMGLVDYAATSFDDVLQAFNRGADIRRFYSTARVPLQALVVAPNRVTEITSFKDLEGRMVGIVSRGSFSEALTLFLMKKEGADGKKIEFIVLGPNIYEPLRLGLVYAAWVGEPALSLLNQLGGRALVNLMETSEAEKYLGGRYEFMGVSVRAAEIATRREQMRALARALDKGLSRLQKVKPEEITKALPQELLAGVDIAPLNNIFARYRASLYPTEGTEDVAACQRVADTLKFTGLIRPEVKAEQVLDLSIE